MTLNSAIDIVNISDEWEYISSISSSIRKKSGKVFFYLNSHTFYLLNHDRDFKTSIKAADYFIADGYSIAFAAKVLQKREIEKVVFTHSFMNELGFFLSENKFKLFLLGSDDSTLEIAVDNINQYLPGVRITGTHHGFIKDNTESEEIIKLINNTEHDILLVGMGMPISELWIAENHEKINSKCIISVGGFIDQIAGKQVIAPKWTHNSGLEWLFRLLHEPRRLFTRYNHAHSFYLRQLIKEQFQK